MAGLRSAAEALSRAHGPGGAVGFALLVASGMVLSVATPLSLNVRIACLGGVAYLLWQVLQPVVARTLGKKCEEAEPEALPTAVKSARPVKRNKASKAKPQALQEVPAPAPPGASVEEPFAAARGDALSAAKSDAAEVKNARVEKLLAKKAQRKAARKASKDAAEAAEAAPESDQRLLPPEAEATRAKDALMQPTEAQGSTVRRQTMELEENIQDTGGLHQDITNNRAPMFEQSANVAMLEELTKIPLEPCAQAPAAPGGSPGGANAPELRSGGGGAAGAAVQPGPAPAAPEADTMSWAEVNEDGWSEPASLGANISAESELLSQDCDPQFCQQGAPWPVYWISNDLATCGDPSQAAEVFQAPSILVDFDGGTVPVCQAVYMMVVNQEAQPVEFSAPQPLLWQQEQPHMMEYCYGSREVDDNDCWAWVKYGQCRRGANCKWLHPQF